MTFTGTDVISFAALAASVLAILGYYNRVFRWVQKQDKQECDLRSVKEEQRILCVALSACLDGLMQLGANHDVPKAKKELDAHIRAQAHR